MSVWKRKAIECLPEHSKEFAQPGISIYQVFFELLPATVLAHREGATERLKLFYDFAAWCFAQKEEVLWNAAGVAFYEHLGDFEETRSNMAQWIKPDIYKQIRSLLQARLTNEDLRVIDGQFGPLQLRQH